MASLAGSLPSSWLAKLGARICAMDAVGIDERDHILDIGCGHGRGLTELAARARNGRVVGDDPSGLMVEIARERNLSLIQSGRADVIPATVESLPFPDGSFEKVLCVHVLYFWKDLDAPLHEIARVLKPGGRLGLLFRTRSDTAAALFPPEIYRFPSFEEVEEALERAALIKVASDCASEPVLLLAEKRRA
jgi:ubiquinone/menaquinone biosynthesis C-methylase UbiE